MFFCIYLLIAIQKVLQLFILDVNDSRVARSQPSEVDDLVYEKKGGYQTQMWIVF